MVRPFVPAGTRCGREDDLRCGEQVGAAAGGQGVLQKEGTDVMLSRSPEDFADFLANDTKFWAQLVKQAGIKID